ncbi:hypothetical protein TYRP_008685 [Tyrophagus putrescentiae]|nr:hypothetical protein TYRP_008685 [Tyrophagus putrescentiae]
MTVMVAATYFANTLVNTSLKLIAAADHVVDDVSELLIVLFVVRLAILLFLLLLLFIDHRFFLFTLLTFILGGSHLSSIYLGGRAGDVAIGHKGLWIGLFSSISATISTFAILTLWLIVQQVLNDHDTTWKRKTKAINSRMLTMMVTTLMHRFGN